MMEVVANSKQTSGNISRHTVPALLLVALNMIWFSGPAEDSITSLMLSPATKRRHVKKMKPEKVSKCGAALEPRTHTSE